MSEFVINLVFDNFDEDGNPIPNGSHIPKIRATIPNELISNTNIKTKLYHIDDVTNDDIFYYIIYYNINLKDIIYESFIVSEKAIDSCKNKNLKILFVTYHEVNHNEFEILQQMIKYISNFGLDENNFYYINNNSRLEEYKNILNSKINTYTSILLFELLAFRINIKEPFFKENKNFLFSCHNKKFRKHRINTLCFLKKYDILKNTDWTFLDTSFSWNDFKIEESTGYFLFVVDEIDYFKKIGLKYSKYESKDIHELTDKNGNDITSGATSECFTNSYINIITETYFDYPEVHITEKSYRPFYFMQLPIFVATYEHVLHLRKRFGFDMFDDLIDHSYDLENDHIKRMKMVFDEIKRLNDNKDLVIEFYKNNKDRFQKNLDLFRNIHKQNQTINFFKKISNKNDAIVDNIDKNSYFKGDGIKIYHDIIVPNKCGTRYLQEYLLLNTGAELHNGYYNNSIDVKHIWEYPYLNWIVIRHPEEYLESALKTDLIDNWNKNDISELDLINKYLSYGTRHYFNNLYKTLYSYSLNYKNVTFVNLKDLTDFCSHMFINKKNIKYDSAKYNMMGKYYMDIETIIDYVKGFYPSQWDTIQINLKKEMFFYNKIIENCMFFNKISHPPIIIKNEEVIKEVIEKNSWLKKVM